MKKPTFQRCLRAVGSMTSVQRHDLRVSVEWRDKKDQWPRWSLWWGILRLSSLPPSGDPVMGARGRTPALPGAGDANAPSMRRQTRLLRGFITRTAGCSSWKNSTKGSLFGRRPGNAESTRKRPFCGDTDSWPCAPASGPGRKAASQKPTRLFS